MDRVIEGAGILATRQNPVLMDMSIFVRINRPAQYASGSFGLSQDLKKQRT